MKAAIYARVSTADQNCEMQLGELREYVSRRGWIWQVNTLIRAGVELKQVDLSLTG
jgi:DNA invertase Pin-like site-specific DNA recombinase